MSESKLSYPVLDEQAQITRSIQLALEEDIGTGDITSLGT